MDVFDLYDKNACNIAGKYGSDSWTWHQFFEFRKELEQKGTKVVLVDMIGYPIEDSVEISNELFFDNLYPEGTYFALYCHSGGSSGYVQQQLKVKLPQYNFVNMEGGIGAYQFYKQFN